jgi:uncharacterized protein
MRRILSIDGGAIKGVFPASFLTTLEESLGQPIAKFFDLIVGTSTGGIIALGLGLGLSAKQILSFYEERGPSIFKGTQFARALRQIGISKYSSDPLREALQMVFEDRRLGESTTRLVVPSCNLDTGEVHIWKTSHHPRLERDYKVPVVEVALSTAAAPTYFPRTVRPPAFRSSMAACGRTTPLQSRSSRRLACSSGPKHRYAFSVSAAPQRR